MGPNQVQEEEGAPAKQLDPDGIARERRGGDPPAVERGGPGSSCRAPNKIDGLGLAVNPKRRAGAAVDPIPSNRTSKVAGPAGCLRTTLNSSTKSPDIVGSDGTPAAASGIATKTAGMHTMNSGAIMGFAQLL